MGLVWRKDDLLTLAEKQVNMANETCQQKIYAGIDVELSGGTEHFSLETHDQANIESMFTAVTLGAKEQQYHCDGGEVKTYSAADVVVLYAAYKNYVTKQTTYCNLLKKWIKRETDNAVIGAIQYGDNPAGRPDRADEDDPRRRDGAAHQHHHRGQRRCVCG